MLVLGAAFVGWCVLSASSTSFSPPFSNNDYSCRCLPRFDEPLYKDIRASRDVFLVHRKMCELRSYVRDLDQYRRFCSELIEGKTDDIADWFVQQGQRARAKQMHKFDAYSWFFNTATKLSKQQKELQVDVLRVLKDFPFEALKQKIQSKALVQAIDVLQKTGSIKEFDRCWEALTAFAREDKAENDKFNAVFAADLATTRFHHEKNLPEPLEQHIVCSYVALKDIANIVHSFYWFFAAECARGCVAAKASNNVSPVLAYFIPPQHIPMVVNFFKFFSYIEDLQLDRTIEEIARFIRRFTTALNDLQESDSDSDDGEADPEAEATAVGSNDKVAWWLRSKWAILSLTVGAVVVKILQYLCTEGGSGSSPFSLGGHPFRDAADHEYQTHATKEKYVQS